MSLARAWRRQLYGASSAALIVPFAMFAALLVLGLGGGFSQVGVLGQIFAGPPAPSAGGAVGGSAAGVSGRSNLTSIPVIHGGAGGPASGRGVPAGGGRGAVAPVSSGGGGAVVPVSSGRTGGALGGGAAPVVASAPVRSTSGGAAPPRPSPVSPVSPVSAGASGPASPPPGPQPQPTPVDQIVNTVTPVAQQVPAPVGPIATQAVQAAGSAADGLLPPSGAPTSLPPGLGVR